MNTMLEGGLLMMRTLPLLIVVLLTTVIIAGSWAGAPQRAAVGHGRSMGARAHCSAAGRAPPVIAAGRQTGGSVPTMELNRSRQR